MAETTISKLDRELAAAALRKRQQGEQPTRAEMVALRRFEAAREEQQRWEHYASIPKRHWQQLSGRQSKVLNEQAVRYGLPVGGPTIDLAAVARWLHDFLAKHARRLATLEEEADPLLAAGGTSPALEEYRRERAKLARLERLEREGALVARDDVHAVLTELAGVLRRMGDELQRKHGAAAQRLVDETLDAFAQTVGRWLGAAEEAVSDQPSALSRRRAGR